MWAVDPIPVLSSEPWLCCSGPRHATWVVVHAICGSQSLCLSPQVSSSCVQPGDELSLHAQIEKTFLQVSLVSSARELPGARLPGPPATKQVFSSLYCLYFPPWDPLLGQSGERKEGKKITHSFHALHIAVAFLVLCQRELSLRFQVLLGGHQTQVCSIRTGPALRRSEVEE